ncbi:SLATT domain-containing protein [Methylophaga sp.]|uniref:SLATT domain-containing protein n=1 Tax=Methylophaga sp. TaxID=2024840 RepID=UPI003A93290B
MVQKENHYEELLDRVQKTSTCRLFAHERLKAHHSASLWTISCFSMGLVFIPLVHTFGLQSRFTLEYSSFIQVVLAIVILVISIILNMTNFSVRADRIHRCGMQLNTLARRIHRHINDDSGADTYDSLVKEYDDILQRYENHSRIDYLYTKNHMTNYYKTPWYFSVYIRVLFIFQFLPYLLLLSLEVIWIWYLVTPVT